MSVHRKSLCHLLPPMRAGACAIVVALLAGVAGAQAQGTGSPAGVNPPPVARLSIAAALERVTQVSDALSAANAQVGSKKLLAEATDSLRLPEISLDIRELQFQKTLEMPLGSLAPVAARFGIPDPLRIQERDWRTRPTLNLVMPLYTGGQIPAAQQAAAAAVRQAEAERAAEAQTQAMQVIQAYFGQLLTEQALKVRQQVRDGLQRHLDDTEKLERAGMATKAQRLQATVARDQAERELQKAVYDQRTARATLARLLRSNRPLEATTPLFVLTGAVGEEALFQRDARDRHPQLARVRALVDQAEQGVHVQESKLKPQIFLFGQRDLKRKDALLTDSDWAFGVGLKYTFLSGSDRPRQIGAAREQLRQAGDSLREAENQIGIGVVRAWNQLETLRQHFRLLDSSLALAEENLRLQELSFREGQSTSLDVIDARLRLGGVSLERAQAAYQFDVILAQLLELSGQIERFPEYAKRADKVISP